MATRGSLFYMGKKRPENGRPRTGKKTPRRRASPNGEKNAPKKGVPKRGKKRPEKGRPRTGKKTPRKRASPNGAKKAPQGKIPCGVEVCHLEYVRCTTGSSQICPLLRKVRFWKISGWSSMSPWMNPINFKHWKQAVGPLPP